jgi:uncharacterized protein YecT (DUF1311 family)
VSWHKEKVKMNIILKVFLAFMLTSSGYVFASQHERCIETAMTQLEMNKCSGINYKTVDDELNRVYKLLKKTYEEDKIFLAKLQAAQRVWIQLRDADFEMKFPHADQSRYYYGSIFPSCANDFKIQLTLQRIAFLKRWLVGSEEGDICSGSIMNKLSIRQNSSN